MSTKRTVGQFREAADREYSEAEDRKDPVAMAIWARANEKARRLALVYSYSERHEKPQIGSDAVTWTCKFVEHQTRRMLFMAHNHVAENPFHAECLKLIRKLREAPARQLAHSVLLKRMKIDAKTFQELITTLEQQGDLATVIQQTEGRPQRAYRLIDGDGVGESRG